MNYFLVPLHTYIFSTQSYGIVGEMYAYVSLLIVLLTYGMETAFFRFYQLEKEKKERVYSTTLISITITSFLFVIIALIFNQNIASTLRYPNNAEYIQWFAIIIAFDALSTIPFAKLRALNRPKKFAFIKFFNVGVNVGLNLFFLLLCPYLLRHDMLTGFVNSIYSEKIGVGYIFIANLAASASSILLLSKELFKIKFEFDAKLLKTMLKYAFPLLILGLAGIINETMDRVFLKYFSPTDITVVSKMLGQPVEYFRNMTSYEIAQCQVGIYSACYKISIMMTIFVQAFKYAAEPFFFSNAKNENAKQLYADVMKYFVIACSLIFLGIMMYFDVAMLFVGKSFRIGAPVVPILLMANLFLGIFYNLSIWYKLTDQTRFGAYISIFGAIITMLLNYALIPVFGYIGAAWATFTCYFSMMVASYFLGQKYYHVNYDLKRIFGYLALAVALYFLSVLIKVDAMHFRLLFNTFLLIIFVLVIILIERPKLLKFKR
jgi:O-antigen/teichoic acid export membrane protein